MPKSNPHARRVGGGVVSALALIFALGHAARAQRATPNPALLPSPNPLCDGLLVPCLAMDDFAGHAYLQPQLLPATELRDTAAVLPFGVALGLAGRVSGGLSTHFTFWKEGAGDYRQFGPLRLSLTIRLLPIFPLWGGSGDSEGSGAGPADYAPQRGFRLGLACYDEPDKVKRQTKKLWCLQPPGQPQTAAQYLMRRWAGGIDRSQEELARHGAQLRQTLDEGAQGVPLHATTPVKEAESAARETITRLKNVTPEDAERTFHAVLTGTRSWLKKPLPQKLGDLTEAAGEAMASPSTYIPGGMLGTESRLIADGAEAAADAAKAGKTATQAAKAVDHAGRVVAGMNKAEKQIITVGGKAKDVARTGRGKNHLHPDTTALGPHSTFRRDETGALTHHVEWTPNPRQPDTGFDAVKRVDIVGDEHINKKTLEAIPTPHTHDKTAIGGIRAATKDELPQ